MKWCSICRKVDNDVKVVHVPKCLEKRKLWEQILDCSFAVNSKICDSHFDASQWRSPPKEGQIYKRRRLKADAVPHGEPEPKFVKLGFANSSTQTEDNVINHAIRVENESLRKQNRRMQKEMHSLRQQLEDFKELEISLKTIFTETQINILKSGGKRAVFNATDMSAAICLHTAGPPAYNHLYRKGFPLPSRATLYRWLADVNISTGTLDVVIDLMENEEMPEVDKLCVLSFDEMKVAAAFEHDSSADVDYEPSTYVQLAIARGLNKSWEQPVFFDFSTLMDADTLHSIINKLHKRGYPVVAIVSDLGAGNQTLWTELGISETKNWFTHPADEDLKIFVFSDTPHLIKLVRDQYVDSGLIINGKRLTKSTVQQTISHCAKPDVSMSFNITDNHLNIGPLAKQNIKLATQLFSNTTGSFIRRCNALGYNVQNASETADLFKIINDWFAVFNSKSSTSNSIEPTQPYGKQIEIQRGILAKMSEIMSSEILGVGAHSLPFQKGILVNNASLEGLYCYLSEKYEMQYIFTSRLSQDIVENFFIAMRPKGEQFEHPTPLQFKFMLRKYISGMTKLNKPIDK
ncbi:blast:Transposable element P transposase [Drosophila guanche]|uniref:Blast:Transposable element P transposase n=1 Tax=Drosophila guanche TaxID=7266 RepID=A0A3B0K7T6_DROGU|nr:blast:Transposable element P transposase [Drosophila guanche]